MCENADTGVGGGVGNHGQNTCLALAGGCRRSGCQYAQELLTLYPDPAELYDALRAGTEAPPACLTPHALAQLRDTTPFDYEERLDHCLLSGIDVLTPDEGVYPDRLRELPDLPLALYVTGDIACLNGRRYAGMVGTRRPSTYGRQAAFDLSLAMARAASVARQRPGRRTGQRGTPRRRAG